VIYSDVEEVPVEPVDPEAEVFSLKCPEVMTVPVEIDNLNPVVKNSVQWGGLSGSEQDDESRLYTLFIQLTAGLCRPKAILNPRIGRTRILGWTLRNTDKLVGSDGLFAVNEALHSGDRNCRLRPSHRAVYRIEDGAYLMITFNGRGAGELTKIVLADENGICWDSEKYNSLMVRFASSLSDADRERPRDYSAFDKLVLDDALLSDIKSDIDNFLKSRDLYINKLKIPWKRGYMLIGPPGVGKTLFIKCLCRYYGLTAVPINQCISCTGELKISQISNTTALEDACIKADPVPIVVVMEDIDKFIAFQGGEKGKDAASISLHEVLRAMDGIEEISNVIIIATTNFGNVLSDALINRPGRFDRVFKVDLPSRKAIMTFLVKREMEFSDISLDEVAARLEGCSMAFVEEFVKSMKMTFKANRFDRAQAECVLERIRRHNDIYEELSRMTGKIGFGN